MIDLSSINYKFTVKQFIALQMYMKTGNKSTAYAHAYETNSPNVHKVAYKLFQTPHMKAAVELINAEALKLLASKMNDMVIDKAWVLHRAALLANFNIRKFIQVDDRGTAVYNFKDATDDDWYCISEYTVDEISKNNADGLFLVDRVKLKTVDKLKALELVGRHVDVQAFKDQIAVDGHMTQVNMTSDEYKTARAEALKEDDC